MEKAKFRTSFVIGAMAILPAILTTNQKVEALGATGLRGGGGRQS